MLRIGSVSSQWTKSQKAAVRTERSESSLSLRFVAAVSVSCSGDKSDKEESAGGFCGYGDCALPAPQSRNGSAAALVAGDVGRLGSVV